MIDLFGNPVVIEPVPSPKKRATLPQAVVAQVQQIKPDGVRRPRGKVADLWLTYTYQPKTGRLVYFNAGTGYDLTAQKKNLMNTCFGYILAVNENTGEVLVHIPKPLMTKAGTDQWYVVPFYDLLPVAVVKDFDEVEYCREHPIQPCPLPVFWNTTRNPQ